MSFSSFASSTLWAAMLASMACHDGLAQEHELKLDLGPLFNFGQAFELSPEAVEQKFSQPGFQENPYIYWDGARTSATFSERPYSNIAVNLSLLDGGVPLTSATIDFSEGKARTVSFDSTSANEATLNRVRAKLTEMLGCTAVPGPKPISGTKGEESFKASLWSSDKGVALLSSSGQLMRLAIAPAKTPPALISKVRATSRGMEQSFQAEFFVRLDAVLQVPALWELSPAGFEALVKTPGSFTKSPCYKWNTTAKDSALLTRHVFSNTSTDLLMFDDAVNAEETLIEFKNGKASKVTITLLTRGNSGEEAAGKFDSVFKATGRALGVLLKVAPTQTVPAGRNLIKTQGYLWSTPHTLALMEFNEGAPKGKVEFLRLKLMPGNARAELLNLAGIGDTVTTKRKASLASNIKRDAASGDIYLAGVPMIDQGQKGYCVSASCARVFNYLGVKCDQDEIAELVKNDAVRGTSPNTMYSALKKIDQQYNMRVKVVKLPRNFGLQGMRENEVAKAWKGDLSKLVQENVGAGIPLLWAVELPLTPVTVRVGQPGSATPVMIEDPQSGGGHMRLIIGYNTKTSDVIFTDSWGAGHEIKRMSLRDADTMTQAVFTMQPAQ